jgi:glycosyltransferase involved in cell wall biosynthesis
MKILALSTWYPFPPDNGSKIRAYYLLREVCRVHDVALIAFNPDGATPADRTLPLSEAIVVQVDPFRHVHAPQIVKYASPIPLAFWPSRDMQTQVQRLIEREPWDAIVAIQTPVGGYARPAAHTPRLIDVDTAFSYQMWQRFRGRRDPRTWLSWQKTRRYEARLFKQFDALTIAADHEVAFLQAELGCTAPIEVIANGVDCEFNRPDGFARTPGRLIYNGALTYGANYDAMQFFLRDIYPLIKQQQPQVTLAITGSTRHVNTAALALDDSVTLTGYVDDIRAAVGGSDVAVIPLRQGAGTRLKILEAMALGVPVVSTSKGAEGLEVRHGQHLLIADEPGDFAAQTVRVLNDPTLRRALVGQARQLVEARYNWIEIGRRFREVIERTVERYRREDRSGPD